MAIDWGEYKAEDLDEDRKESDRLSEGEWIKWKDGENVVRVLPPLPGVPGDRPWKLEPVHYFKPPGAKFSKAFVCPGAGCRACIMADELMQNGNGTDLQAGKDLRKRLQGYFRCIDRSNEDAGPRKAQLGGKPYNSMLGLMAPGRRQINIVDPMKGHDIVVIKTPVGGKNHRGVKNDTSYPKIEVEADLKPVRLGTDDQMRAWLEMAKPIAKLPPYLSAREIEQVLMGEGAEEPREQRAIGGRSDGRRTVQDEIDDETVRKFASDEDALG